MLGLGLGLGVARRRGGAAAPVIAFASYAIASDPWTPNNVTLTFAPTPSPDGGLATNMLETTATGNHDAAIAVPLVDQRKYRVRFLLQGINETMITVNSSVDGGGKYWIGTFGTGVPALANGFYNPVSTAGDAGFTIFTLDLNVLDATAFPVISIGIAKPGPSTFFTGVATDGLLLASMIVYDLGAWIPSMRFNVPDNQLYAGAISAF